jgi:hypothetical protein
MSETTPPTDVALAELKALHAGLHCSFGGIGGKIVDAFPQLLARLEAVERERDHHRLIREEAMEESCSLKDELHRALYCLELNGIADDGVCEKLAARDARLKIEGAVAKLMQMSKSGLAWDEKDLRREAEAMLIDVGMTEAAAQLRREGE